MSELWSGTIGDLLAREGGSIKTGPFGTTLKAAEYSQHGVPVVSVGEVGYGRLQVRPETPRAGEVVVTRLPEYLLAEGDIVFGRKGAVDRSAYVLPEQAGWFLGSDGIRLRLPATVDAKFVSYQLQTQKARAWLVQHATGSTMPSLNQAVIERIPIVLPRLTQQRRIAGILAALDDKIELNRRLAATVEATARDLAEKLALVEASPDVVRAGTLADLAELNPESWSPPSRPEEIRYVDLTGTKAGEIREVAVCRGTERPSRAQRVLRPGDTIVGTVRPGNRSFALVAESGLTGSTGFAQLRALNPADSALLYLVATSDAAIDRLAHLADGAAYPAVRPTVVLDTPVRVPDRRTLNRFSAAATPLLERAASARRESMTLGATRDALLPRLLSGELEVPA